MTAKPEVRKPIRSWRVSKAEPSGLQVWFDPVKEFVRLYALEPSEIPRVADALERGDQLDLVFPLSSKRGVVLSDDLPF